MADLNIIKINKLLNDVGYKSKINNLKDLKSFLNNPENRKLDVYEEVEEIYDILMLGSGIW